MNTTYLNQSRFQYQNDLFLSADVVVGHVLVNAVVQLRYPQVYLNKKKYFVPISSNVKLEEPSVKGIVFLFVIVERMQKFGRRCISMMLNIIYKYNLRG